MRDFHVGRGFLLLALLREVRRGHCRRPRHRDQRQSASAFRRVPPFLSHTHFRAGTHPRSGPTNHHRGRRKPAPTTHPTPPPPRRPPQCPPPHPRTPTPL